MQERTNPAFVVATANDVRSLPPELLRKGRFDEIFFVDLPNSEEREAVLTATLRAHGRGKVKIDLAKIAEASEGFTGSEIAALIPEALYSAFADKAREIGTSDILEAASITNPLSKVASEKIEDLRSWAKQRGARRANKPEEATTSGERKRRFRAIIDN